MNLNRARSLVRPMLSLDNEYRVRSLASTLVPGPRASVRRGYHFCNWKTGSQWVRLLLSDPRLQRQTGLPVRLYHNGVGHVPAAVSRQFPRVDRFIATPLFAGSDLLENIAATADDRAIFVTRHPRDLLVSFYFSNLQSHPLNDDVYERRLELTSVDTEDGLLRTMDHGFDEMIRIGDSWSTSGSSGHLCPARVVTFEALCGEQAEVAWTGLIEHLCGTTVDASLVRRLLRTYSADSMRGSSPATSKLRDRSTASWEHHFTDRVENEFRSRYANVEERWGYAYPHTREAIVR